MSNIALIAARGGSKGIPRKNLYPFCSRPLLSWSILQANRASSIDSVWVTSDDEEILSVSRQLGAQTILRPSSLASDTSSSESAWIHAIDTISSTTTISSVVALQTTSPLRTPDDIDSAVELYKNGDYDSIFSAVQIEDFFIWKTNNIGVAEPLNHDFKNRLRRQDLEPSYVENGSIYIFRPEQLTKTKNRLHGRIGVYEMEHYKKFQIDSFSDIEFCECLMKHYRLDKAYV